jgi:hypothetical protein
MLWRRVGALVLIVASLVGCGGSKHVVAPAEQGPDLTVVRPAFSGIALACLSPRVDKAQLARWTSALIAEFRRSSPDATFRFAPGAPVLTMRKVLNEMKEQLRNCAAAGVSADAAALAGRIDVALADAPAAPDRVTNAAERPPAAPVPNANGSFTHNCAYVLGDFSESKSGLRFVADATLTNTGNIGILARVTASWAQAGTTSITDERIIRVPYHRSRTVHITRVARSDEIDLQQAAGGNCNVRVRITGTFGGVYGRQSATATTAGGRLSQRGGSRSPSSRSPGVPVLRARLVTAGHTVLDADVGSGTPRPDSALQVIGGGSFSVTIYVYASPGDAAVAAATFDSLVHDRPQQVDVERVGSDLYVGTVTAPARVPVKEFDRIVSAAEGR